MISKLGNMKIYFNRFPADVILCMLCSVILVPFAILDTGGTIRIILSLPFVLFFPGYMLIFALFPHKKTDRGIDFIERIGLSIGLSIMIVPLIGLGLNFTQVGINLVPLLSLIFIFIFGIGIIGIFRWFRTNPNKRFIISIDISISKSGNKIDKTLNILLIITIVIAVSSLIYVVITPKTGEQFTEFYILGSDGIADNYPRYVQVGESAEGIVGIINHEYKTVDYTVEIWLINQTITYDEAEQKNITIIHNMWFIDKLTTTLEHSKIDLEQSWTPQWEAPFSCPINFNGSFKLVFLLFTTPTEEYTYYEDYKHIAEEKLESAYRGLHLWIDVPYTTFYLSGPNGATETHYRNILKGENVTGITGIVNHEYKTVNYTIEVWLVNQTITYNETMQENITTIHNFWFVDKITTLLNHTEQSTQWEHNYSFMINRTGSFKLVFLLFPLPTEGYFQGLDYIEKANIKFISAYKEKNIMIDVT